MDVVVILFLAAAGCTMTPAALGRRSCCTVPIMLDVRGFCCPRMRAVSSWCGSFRGLHAAAPPPGSSPCSMSLLLPAAAVANGVHAATIRHQSHHHLFGCWLRNIHWPALRRSPFCSLGSVGACRARQACLPSCCGATGSVVVRRRPFLSVVVRRRATSGVVRRRPLNVGRRQPSSVVVGRRWSSSTSTSLQRTRLRRFPRACLALIWNGGN